jgi:signal transduction histidine kinase
LGVLRAESKGQDPVREPYADLASLVAASAHAGQPVELHDTVGALPQATARVVYRTVQEGLTNAHKHAPGAPTTVSIGRDDRGRVTVTVHNDAGTGGLADLPGSGSGLVGLGERIRLVGGSLRSGPLGADGWELHAVVPWLDQRIEDEPAEVGTQ